MSSLRPSPREKGPCSFGPAPTAATEGWRTSPWPFASYAEPAISFGEPVAEENLNICYTLGMVNEPESVEKALMASSSVAVTFEGSVNLATLMVDSGALGHYFDDAIIRDLKHRLQDYVNVATFRKILTAGGALLDCMVEGVLQGLVTDDYGNQILVRVNIVVVSGIRHNLFSVMTTAKKGIVTTFDYENPRLEGFNVTVLLRSESVDLYLFVLDLSGDHVAPGS